MGEWMLDNLSIGLAFSEEQKQIMTTSAAWDLATIHRLLPPVIWDDINHRLTLAPSDLEIYNVIKSLNSWKALGLDGLNGEFFKSTWSITGPPVCNFIRGFFIGEHSIGSIKNTYLVPIPKFLGAQAPMDYRPIGLCNELYKIISKLLEIRLKQTLPDIISHSQSTFLRGRQFIDNVAIAMECFKHIRSGKKKNKSCTVKIDLSKAFDRLEWKLLIEIILSLGYSQAWCNLLYECISTTSISALIDVAPYIQAIAGN